MTDTNTESKKPERKKTVSTVAISDVKRLEKSLNALNVWYILALYLLLFLASGLAVWAAYSKHVFAPYTYMYVIAFVTLIAGVTFRYFAVTRFGSFIIGLFALLYMLAWVWILFDQAFTGVMTGGSPKSLIHPKEFYVSAVLLAFASLWFVAQPIVQFRRKRLLKRVAKHVESSNDVEIGNYQTGTQNTGVTEKSEKADDS